MLARIPTVIFIAACMLSSFLGATLAWLLSRNTTNSFGDLLLVVTLVPIGLVCPPMILATIRREQKQSLEYLQLDESRRGMQLRAPELANSPNTHLSTGETTLQEEDYYSLLGAEPTASEIEIQEKYTSILENIQAGGEPLENEPKKTEAIEKAYAILNDPEERLKYDLSREAAQVGTSTLLASAPYVTPRQPPKANDPLELHARTSISLFVACLVGATAFIAGVILSFILLRFLVG